ncbi:MAG: TonB-dependent receptor [Myxococcales bacterium]|nr:TonB-dependent receptor [Myxococcales bacterium]
MSDGLQRERLLQEADVRPLPFRVALVLVLLAQPLLAEAQPAEPPDRYTTVVHARPKRDRAAAIVITARELQERGVDNLSQALDLVPQLAVRQGGRGPTMVDMRGQKQRSIMVLVDGAPMDEPYYGAFDLSSIPVTDIVEIRITLTPASPLEGPGGDGGIIEVITMRAVGGRRVNARLRVSEQPDLQGAVSGRTPIVERWGLAARASAGGRYGSQDFVLTLPNGAPGKIGEPLHQAHGALRLEHESRSTLSTVDGWISHRSYWSPPTEDVPASIIFIEGETDARLVAGTQLTRNRLRLAAGLYSQWISMRSNFYANGVSLATPYDSEQLDANRTGAALHVDQGLGRGFSVSARASIDEESATVRRAVARPVSGSSTYGEVAAGASWAWRSLRADGAIGLAAPLGGTQPPWAEGKLTVLWTPNQWINVRATGARKGRQPTLRERFDPLTGNAKLDPEQSWFAELAVAAQPHPLLNLRATGYYRYTNGLIRLDVETRTHSVNYDNVATYGLESGFDVASQKWLSAGATYVWEEAVSPTLGLNAVNNFPRHKFDAWLAARFKRDAGALLRFRWVGGRVDSGVPLADYALVDMTAWVRIVRSLRATLLVSNVADQRYQMRAGVSSLGRVVALSLEGTWE